jgi:hypothetical protein
VRKLPGEQPLLGTYSHCASRRLYSSIKPLLAASVVGMWATRLRCPSEAAYFGRQARPAVRREREAHTSLIDDRRDDLLEQLIRVGDPAHAASLFRQCENCRVVNESAACNDRLDGRIDGFFHAVRVEFVRQGIDAAADKLNAIGQVRQDVLGLLLSARREAKTPRSRNLCAGSRRADHADSVGMGRGRNIKRGGRGQCSRICRASSAGLPSARRPTLRKIVLDQLRLAGREGAKAATIFQHAGGELPGLLTSKTSERDNAHGRQLPELGRAPRQQAVR